MRHSGPIAALSSVGDAHLVTGGYDGSVGLYAIERRAYIAHHGLHTGLVTSVSATADTIISGSADASVWIVQVVDGTFLPRGSMKFDDDVESVLALDDSTFLVGLGDGSVNLMLRHPCGVIDARQVVKRTGTITAIRALADGRVVVSGNDGSVDVVCLQPKGPAIVRTIYSSDLPVKNCVVVPGDGRVVAGGHDGVMVAVEVDGERPAVVVHRFPSSVRGLAVANGELLAGCYSGTISRFSLPNFDLIGPATVGSTPGEVWTRQLVAGGNGKVYAASMNGLPVAVGSKSVQVNSNLNCVASAGPQKVVVGADDGQILQVTHMGDRISLQHIASVGECVTSVAVGSNGIAACTWNGGLFVNGVLVRRFVQPLLGLDWVESDLAVGDYQGQVHRVARDGCLVATVAALPSSTKRVVAHRDLVFVVGRYGPAVVLDRGSWTIIGTIDIATRVCDALAVSPSGEFVAIAASRNNIWVYSLEGIRVDGTPLPVRRLEGHVKPPKDIVWAEDTILFSTGYDATVVRHDLTSATSQLRHLGAIAETGVSGLAVVDAVTVLAVAFDGGIHEVSFDA